eukprot:CAMPEP_0195053704 /NCGR_PEP_ID=MMETSP0448-20130528/2744_1 /TAXON_ID=66468 /ORGANISM="Heterocapsa triquestra, Strain CCMP 448" /LENGTH=458 /DNA_ID=CAMNT_0040083035 /DNA_START=68 /DNA_END=1441 /DNA_ORIENTATION=+
MMRVAKGVCLAALVGLAAADSPGTERELLERFSALQAEMRQLKEQSRLHDDELLRDIESNDKHISELESKPAADGRRLSSYGELGVAATSCWLIICGALVMFMQAGFAMVESGCCRAKNVQNILMKNLCDVCVGTICWYAFGWTVAYGGPLDEDSGTRFISNGNNFMGTEQYFGHEFSEIDENGNFTELPFTALGWFFQWAFCSAAATIVSGGVAERANFPGYLIYSIFMTTFIYPVIVAWTWGYGWLSAGEDNINDAGFMDFAGSGVVHMTGGVGALVGAICVGPRAGRFESPEDFQPHSLPLIVLGTFILWFGWYGFNCGSTLGMSDAATGAMAAQVAMNTTLSASMGGITVLILRLCLLKKYDIGGMCNGILAGLVSITAGCGNVESGSALIIGLLGGFVYQGTSSLLQKLKVDDPIDAFAVHGASGAWGVMAAVFFDWGTGMDYFNGWSGFSCM